MVDERAEPCILELFETGSPLVAAETVLGVEDESHVRCLFCYGGSRMRCVHRHEPSPRPCPFSRRGKTGTLVVVVFFFFFLFLIFLRAGPGP
jgi:hypothetical protein